MRITPKNHHQLLLDLSNPDFADRNDLLGKRVGNTLDLYSQRRCFLNSLFRADHEYVRAAEYLSKVIPASIDHIKNTEGLDLLVIRSNLVQLNERMIQKTSKKSHAEIQGKMDEVIKAGLAPLKVSISKKSALKTDRGGQNEKKVKFKFNKDQIRKQKRKNGLEHQRQAQAKSVAPESQQPNPPNF